MDSSISDVADADDARFAGLFPAIASQQLTIAQVWLAEYLETHPHQVQDIRFMRSLFDATLGANTIWQRCWKNWGRTPIDRMASRR